ncbi:MAG TPA: hypothetical protein VFO91_11425, partial [Anaerolineales bacterium]|nr:hypothetical protein [Anaerolineales bacterium]
MNMDMGCPAEKAKKYLEILCNQIPNRRVGSEGNLFAIAFFIETIKSFGFDAECTEFQCIDWQSKGANLSANGTSFDAQVSPYSLGANVQAPLAVASSVAELETLDISGKILLMRDELTKEQFLPRNFPFFRVEVQQKIILLLESKKPLAIITATTRNPEMAGALYPFPVFEDGDFDIPSVYITEEAGIRLAEFRAWQVSLKIDAERMPSYGGNVVARKGKKSRERVVL